MTRGKKNKKKVHKNTPASPLFPHNPPPPNKKQKNKNNKKHKKHNTTKSEHMPGACRASRPPGSLPLTRASPALVLRSIGSLVALSVFCAVDPQDRYEPSTAGTGRFRNLPLAAAGCRSSLLQTMCGPPSVRDRAAARQLTGEKRHARQVHIAFAGWTQIYPDNPQFGAAVRQDVCGRSSGNSQASPAWPRLAGSNEARELWPDFRLAF